jgi:uncharacterized protein involved in outer membrane biogenesis
VAGPRTRTRLLIALGALVVVLGLARLAMREISTGPLRSRVERELSQALGLAVSVDQLEAAFLPTPHLRASGIHVANFPGDAAPELLTIQTIGLGLEFAPLLRRVVVIDAFEIEGADLHLETDRKGHLRTPFELGAFVTDEGSDPVRFEVRRLAAKNLRVFHRDDRDGTDRSLLIHSVDLESEDLESAITIRIRGEFEGGRIDLSGQVGSLAELLKPSRPFPVDLEGRLFEATVAAKGSVRRLWSFEGVDVLLSGEIPKLVVEQRPLPQLGAVHFTGELSDLDGSLGLERLRLDNAAPEPLHFEAHGKFDDLRAMRDVDLDIDVETSSIDFLKPLLASLVEFPLPAITRSSTHLKLTDQRGRLDLDGTAHIVSAGETVDLRADGGIRDLTGSPTLDMKLAARADDLRSITSLVPDFPEHGPFGPITASGVLKGSKRILEASAIEIHAGDRAKAWVDLQGSIGDVVGLRNVDLAVTFGAQSLHHLKALLERELPHTSKIEGSAAISDDDGTLGIDHLALHGGEESPVEIHLDASFDDLVRRDGIEVELGLRGDDAHALGALAGLDLPKVGPVDFHGKVSGSDEHLVVDGLALQLGQTHLAGDLSGSFAPHERPSVRARITSKRVRLQDLGLADILAGTASSAAGSGAGIEDPVAGWAEDLRRVDLDLGLQLDQVDGSKGLEASDVGFSIRLDDGDLAVSDARAEYQGGQLATRLRVDARTPDPTAEFTLDTSSLNLARLAAQFDPDSDYSGIVDARLDLQAQGDTLLSLRQSLAGRVHASMRDGNAASRIGRKFVLDLSEAVFPGLHTKKIPNIGCALVDLEIEDGIAQVRILRLEGQEVGITGSGDIDLVHGRYDLHIVPRTSNPGILSVAPEVLVSGPLDDPTFHPLKRTLVTSFGRGLLQNAFKPVGTLLRTFTSQGAQPNANDACRVPSRGGEAS